MAQPNVTTYTSSTCPHCKQAKEFLKQHGIEFTNHDVVEDEEKKNEMVEKSGAMSVPVIDVDGEIITGFDKEKLEKVLGVE